MSWRLFALPLIVATLGGLLLVHHLQTEDINLSTVGLSTEDEGAYLGWARAEAPGLWGASDTQLVKVGVAICEAIKRMPDPAVAPSPVNGLTEREVRALTDSATRNLCTDQRDRVSDYLRDTR